MQNSSEYPDHLSVLSPALLSFFSTNLSRISCIWGISDANEVWIELSTVMCVRTILCELRQHFSRSIHIHCRIRINVPWSPRATYAWPLPGNVTAATADTP